MRRAVVTTACLFPGQEAAVEPWNGDLLAFTAPVAGLAEPVLSPDWAG